MESAITSKGQATIPNSVRDHLHLLPGDRVRFFIHPNGSVVLLPRVSVTTLSGMVKPRVPKVTLDDMDRAIADGAAG